MSTGRNMLQREPRLLRAAVQGASQHEKEKRNEWSSRTRSGGKSIHRSSGGHPFIQRLLTSIAFLVVGPH